MEKQIMSELLLLTEEESIILHGNANKPKDRYSKSGRFMIERRRISEMSLGDATAAITMRKHPRFRDFPSHSHDYIEMMYVCQGNVTHVIKGESVSLKAHDLIILGRYTRHSILPTGENDIGVNLVVSTELFGSAYRKMTQSSELRHKKLESLMERDGEPYLVFSAENNIGIRNILENMILSEICEVNSNEYITTSSFSLLLAYLAAMTKEAEREREDNKEKQKRKLMKYIESSYSTATLTEAAEMLGLSPSYLCRLIRMYFGLTFKDLLTAARFDAATEMLTSTDLPIGEIISRVGYENSSYFHKEFKRRYGMTPINYRRTR